MSEWLGACSSLTMRRATGLYLCVVAIAAIGLLVLVYATAPAIPSGGMTAVYLLAAIAVLAEVLAFLLPRATRGSMAFIAYLAMVILVPAWQAVVAVVLVKTITERRARIAWYKAIFNIVQHAFGMSAAVLVYNSLGGVSLLAIPSPTLLHTTQIAGAPALAAFTISYLSNAILVSAAVAIDSGVRALTVLRDLKFATVGLDLLVSPPIFIFAWVYVQYGSIATVTLWVPFLAIRQTHRANLDLAQMNQELLELMVKSLEARDPYTSGHSRRVREFSMTIARAIGCSHREIEEIGRAALLHDVGKIHDKYAPILSKPDKLTREEWVIMKQHPADGAELVATMSKLRDVVPSIRHHHENWDGSGYPDGLTGEAIPFASRIIRLADTIDAMTTHRPYRAPLTEEQVRQEVIRCRGTQFDPTVADRLLRSTLWSALFTPLVEADQSRAKQGPDPVAEPQERAVLIA